MRRDRLVVFLLFFRSQLLGGLLHLLDPPHLLGEIALGRIGLVGGPAVVVRAGLVPLDELDLENVDVPGRDLAGNGLALARVLVERLAVHLEGRVQRRNLLLLAPHADELLENTFLGDVVVRALVDDAADAVVRVGAGAKDDGRLVRLCAVEELRQHLGGGSDANDEHTRSQRIQGASVTNLDLVDSLELTAPPGLPFGLFEALRRGGLDDGLEEGRGVEVILALAEDLRRALAAGLVDGYGEASELAQSSHASQGGGGCEHTKDAIADDFGSHPQHATAWLHANFAGRGGACRCGKSRGDEMPMQRIEDKKARFLVVRKNHSRDLVPRYNE
ncbi:hypothetical protein G6O67_000248 [Ophiocordyceps sinensis]|uniref:Secreted protein n=1 Tax=Ophiocordyceps sinensis TaxID=72228 RepID=A0A8H4PYK9_9HYPO|nr:hypothetical protein G6O67_000248 [Ophiocordyceps sinensis]